MPIVKSVGYGWKCHLLRANGTMKNGCTRKNDHFSEIPVRAFHMKLSCIYFRFFNSLVVPKVLQASYAFISRNVTA